MTLKFRIRRIEERLEHTSGGRQLRTICILCDDVMPTDAQAEAAINDYKNRHPDWDTEDWIEIKVNTKGIIYEDK